MKLLFIQSIAKIVFSFFKKDNKEYKEKIYAAFPLVLKKDVESVADIIPFEQNKIKLSTGESIDAVTLIYFDSSVIFLLNEELRIPYRVYFNEPTFEKEEKLTAIQKTILNCIYLRHHNGYVRQRRLENLLKSNEYWIIPYLLQLVGEYVVEILEVLDKHINENNIHLYTKFIKDNPRYWMQTESRMISYWDYYYRIKKFPKLKEYIGYKIVKRIKQAAV